MFNSLNAVVVMCVESPRPPWSEWSNDEVALLQMTGLNLSEVNWLYEQCRDPLLSLRLSKQQHNENVPPWSPHNLLCVTLHWLRKYPSYNCEAV